MDDDHESSLPLNFRRLEDIKAASPTMHVNDSPGGGYITIPVPTLESPVTFYNIDLVRIDTPLKLLAWVSHLAAKPWMPRQRLREFIRIVSKAQKFELPHNL